MKNIAGFTAFLLLSTTMCLPAWAATNNVSASDVSGALPPDVAKALAQAPNTQAIYPVQGTEVFPGQLIKVDQIVFQSGATLVLSANAPWVVIAARHWKFADPTAWTKIQRDFDWNAGKAPDGNPGSPGANQTGEIGRRGIDGGPGQPGGTGATGITRQVPHIYIIGGDFTDKDGKALPGFSNIALIFRGYDGGDGGNGGPGGNGGHAGNGKEGATHAFDCGEGGGPGGNGGAAGPGGRGGDAGAGGNGADITLVSKSDGIKLLAYADIVNVGGQPGSPGIPGANGIPGGGGAGAGRNGFCSETQPGHIGPIASPRNLGPGNPANVGAKGTVTAVTVDSLAPIFN